MRYLAFLSVMISGALYAAVEYGTEPETGLESWHWASEGVSITFNQRLPDQSRAYFQGRGFSPEAAEQVAQSCVFQTIIRNDAAATGPLTLDLAQWRVVTEGKAPRPLRLESQWQAEWQRLGIAESARVAFRWSLFPTNQSFQPGDWNMGMITVGLQAGQSFDLEVVWDMGGKLRRVPFERMRCAPDRHV